MKPRLLDLFCGAGGAAMGYSRAGFDVVGIDNRPQPRFPFPFIQADALNPPVRLEDFDVVHASPPCQAYVQWNGINRARNSGVPEHPALVDPIRASLRKAGVVYVLENVVGAPLHNPVLVCGGTFSLGVRRHRLFESSHLLMRVPCTGHSGNELAVYGKLDGRRIWTRRDGTEARAPRTLHQAQTAMGIDWMTWDELREAIPPAYTQFIGEQLMEHLRRAA